MRKKNRTPSMLPRAASLLAGFLLAGLLLASPVWGDGVKRRLTIRSNPSGAKVYVDGYDIGRTPVSTYFTYYGTREIRLVREGCETLVVYERIDPPWYQFPVIDFVTENFIPGEIRDHRTVSYRLQPQRLVPRDEIMANAEQFRSAALVEAAALGPLPPPAGTATGPAPPPYEPPGGWQAPTLAPPAAAWPSPQGGQGWPAPTLAPPAVSTMPGGLPPGPVDPFLIPREPFAPPSGWVPNTGPAPTNPAGNHGAPAVMNAAPYAPTPGAGHPAGPYYPPNGAR